jgi:hypothetical protein
MVAVINKDNFGGAPMVSCWTCQHGKNIPATTIALDHLYSEPNGEKDDVIPKDDSQLSADQILQRTVHVTYPESPDRGNQTQYFNGTVGWTTTPRVLLGEYQVTGNELDGLKLDAELAFPGQIREVLKDLRVGVPRCDRWPRCIGSPRPGTEELAYNFVLR